MNHTFGSDNYSGVHPEIMEALLRANSGHSASYGADEYTAKAIEKLLDLAMLGWANKLAGILFYFFLYGIIVSILLFYAVELKLIKADTMQASVTYEWVRPLGPFVINQLAVILPFFRNMFDQLESFFGRL